MEQHNFQESSCACTSQQSSEPSSATCTSEQSSATSKRTYSDRKARAEAREEAHSHFIADKCHATTFSHAHKRHCHEDSHATSSSHEPLSGVQATVSAKMHTFVPTHQNNKYEPIKAALNAFWGSDGKPNMMYISEDFGMPVAVFPVPEIEVQGTKASINPSKFCMAGVALVRTKDNKDRDLWFCDCNAKNRSIMMSAQSLYMHAGGCSLLQDADCIHAEYCRYYFGSKGIQIAEIIEGSPMHESSSASGTAMHQSSSASGTAGIAFMTCNVIPSGMCSAVFIRADVCTHTNNWQ